MAKNKPVGKQKTQTATSRWQKPFWAVVIFMFSFLLYANTFNHGFVLDDLTQIEQNKSVQQGVKAIPEIMSTSYRYGYEGQNTGLYRPLSNVTFAIEYQFAKLKPRLYHFDNVWLFALSCTMLFLMLAGWFKKWHISFSVAAALLFAAHPMHTEVVANIKSRDEILSLLGLITLLWFLNSYLQKNKIIYLVASVLTYFVTLFSKESSVAYLGVVPLMLFFFSDKPLKSIIGISALYIIPVVIFLSILFNILITLESDHYTDVIQNTLLACKGPAERSATTAAIMGIYIRLLLYPVNLLSDYSYAHTYVHHWSDWDSLLSAAIYLALFIYAIIGLKRKDLFSFAIIFFAGTIILVSNIIITISWTLGERFLYTPSLAFCMAVAFGLIRLSRFDYKQMSGSPITKPLFSSVFAVLLIFYIYNTYQRNKDWKSNYTLFSTDVQKAPNNARLHAMYAKGLFDAAEQNGDLRAAIEAENEYRRAVDIYPYRDFINGLGTVYNLKGNYAGARDCFLTVLKKCDSVPDYWHNLGIAYQGLKKFDSAAWSYEQSVHHNPNYIKSIINLGGVYNVLNRNKEAVEMTRRALNIQPTKEIYMNMSEFYRVMGMADSSNYYKRLAQ